MAEPSEAAAAAAAAAKKKDKDKEKKDAVAPKKSTAQKTAEVSGGLSAELTWSSQYIRTSPWCFAACAAVCEAEKPS